MKAFKTENINGIIPIVLNDLKFLSDTTTEMIEAIVSMVSNLTNENSFILNGIIKTGIPATISAGWVVLNGKIYKFEQQAFPLIGEGESVVFRITENIIAEGNKLMKPGLTEVDTYYEYKAEVISTVDVLPDDVIWGLKNFQKIIQDINPISSGWINIVLNNGWEADISYGLPAPQYKIHHNIIYLRGRVLKTGNSNIVAYLPQSIIPAKSSILNNIISVNTSGELTTTEAYLSLNSLYFID